MSRLLRSCLFKTVLLLLVNSCLANDDECLKSHNEYRRLHGVPDLAYDHELASVAQSWANQLDHEPIVLTHRENSQFGENIAWHSSRTISCKDLVKMWYDEINLYDFNNQGFNSSTGHFTQLVWKGTERVGCGMSNRHGVFLVCEYSKPGNFRGMFEQNVLPPINWNGAIKGPESSSEHQNSANRRQTTGNIETTSFTKTGNQKTYTYRITTTTTRHSPVVSQKQSNDLSSEQPTKSIKTFHFTVDPSQHGEMQEKLAKLLKEMGQSLDLSVAN